jgi:hypothetical protein
VLRQVELHTLIKLVLQIGDFSNRLYNNIGIGHSLLQVGTESQEAFGLLNIAVCRT